MRKIYLLFVIGSIISSCSDKTQINLVSGKLFEECEVVLASQEIAIKANVGGFSGPVILGSGISKPDGTYNFTYELDEENSGTGEFILVTTQGFTTIVQGVPLNEDISFDHYKKDTIQITVVLEGSRIYTASDTLFFGYNGTGEEYSVVEPVNGDLISIQSSLSGEFGNTAPLRVYYGVGEVEFTEAKNQTANETAVRNIDLSITPCNLMDTARIEIN